MEACFSGGEGEVPLELLFLRPFFFFNVELFVLSLPVGRAAAGGGTFSGCSDATGSSGGGCTTFYAPFETRRYDSNVLGTK